MAMVTMLNDLTAAVDITYSQVLTSAGKSAYAFMVLMDYMHGIACFCILHWCSHRAGPKNTMRFLCC